MILKVLKSNHCALKLTKLVYSDALRDLVSCVQFKKHEKHPWRSVTFSKVKACNFTKSNTPPWVFFMFFKFYKWYQIAQSITILSLQGALIAIQKIKRCSTLHYTFAREMGYFKKQKLLHYIYVV